MNILILGGTRFFGIDTVEKLLSDGHQVTIATRGKTSNPFADRTVHIILDHRNEESVKNTLFGKKYDVVIDKLAYASYDVKRILDIVDCKRYILMSTSGVYNGRGIEIPETAFDPASYTLRWGERRWESCGIPGEFDYDEGKRQAEAALIQCYSHVSSVSLRYPVVMGKRDYTNRLYFYVEHIAKGIPMFVANTDVRICFVDEVQAGNVFAELLKNDIQGALNICSDGDISVNEIIAYIEKKTGKKSVIDACGDVAPYNSFASDYTLSTRKASEHGLHFSHISDWIFSLLDWYIDKI